MNQFQSGAAVALPSQFSVGGVLNKAYATMMQKPVLFIGFTILAIIPGLVAQYVQLIGKPGAFVLQLIRLTLALMIQGAIAYGTFQAMSHRIPSFGACMSRGMARIGPIFLSSLLIILCVAAAILIVFVPSTFIFGPISFIAPLIILAILLAMGCMWLVTIPACVVEQLGPVHSMQRSAALTKGYRWQILALLVVTSVVIYGLAFTLGYVMTMAFQNLIAGTVVATLLISIPQAFQYVMFAIIYHDLRVVKEGISVETLVSVFE